MHLQQAKRLVAAFVTALDTITLKARIVRKNGLSLSDGNLTADADWAICSLDMEGWPQAARDNTEKRHHDVFAHDLCLDDPLFTPLASKKLPDLAFDQRGQLIGWIMDQAQDLLDQHTFAVKLRTPQDEAAQAISTSFAEPQYLLTWQRMRYETSIEDCLGLLAVCSLSSFDVFPVNYGLGLDSILPPNMVESIRQAVV